MHTTNDISYQELAAYLVRGRVVIANVDQGSGAGCLFGGHF